MSPSDNPRENADVVRIPAGLLPADGRFGCGPSRVRPALARLRSWLVRHSPAIVTVVLLTVGVLAAVSGIALLRSA